MDSKIRGILKDALRAHPELALRSENYDPRRYSFLDLMAENVGLAELETSDWQIVYGRRGTGKTHLLGSFLELKQRTIELGEIGKRDVCFYFSAQNFRVSEETIPNKSKALAYFRMFIDQLADTILKYVDSIIEKDSIISRIIGNRKGKLGKIEEIALRLRYAAQYGDEVASSSEETITTKDTQKNVRKNSASGNVGMKIALENSKPHLTGGVGLTADISNEGESESLIITERQNISKPRFDKVKLYLLQLIDLINIDRVFILIDEWALLDPTSITVIQPEFANLLRKTFMGTGRISVKIASNRFQTRLSSHDDLGKITGLVLHEDIFEAVNLDHALLAETEMKDFYEMMLFKRLCACSGEISSLFLSKDDARDMYRITSDDVPSGFLEMIFRDTT